MAPVVSLRDAVALAGRFPLLAGVTLDVEEGEIVHLSGPNGAGKSSLLRLCCGLLSLRSGHATVLGHDLATERRAVRLQVGYLGHETFLYDELTVEENLVFALRAAGFPPAEARTQAAAAMERLGLGGRLPTLPVAQLSSGQRRRTALAVVVGRRPRLWLLDEPHAGLDHEARQLLDETILEARQGGATVILSSHELGEMAEPGRQRLSDRTVRLAGGRVEGRPTITGAGPIAHRQQPAAATPPGAVHVA